MELPTYEAYIQLLKKCEQLEVENEKLRTENKKLLTERSYLSATLSVIEHACVDPDPAYTDSFADTICDGVPLEELPEADSKTANIRPK